MGPGGEEAGGGGGGESVAQNRKDAGSGIAENHSHHDFSSSEPSVALIVCGGSGPRQGAVPKPGFYEGFYIHLMILRASVS